MAKIQGVKDLAMITSPEGHGQMPIGSDVGGSESEQADIGMNATVATVVVVAAGAALFEAALLPGIAIGVAAVAAPKYLPKLAEALNPLFRSTVRGTYQLAQIEGNVRRGS
jgi:hypothetical protein